MTDAPVAPKSFLLSPELADYLVGHGSPPDAVQVGAHRGDRARSARSPACRSRPSRARSSRCSRGSLGARSAVEVGTFTGYSSLCIARGPRRRRPAAVLRRVRGVDGDRRAGPGTRAGVADRIDLRIAPGADTLRGAARRPRRSTSRSSTPTSRATPCTTRSCSPRLRPNGVLLVDNVLWDGRVVQPDADDENTARDPGLQRHGRRRRPRRRRDAPHRRRPHPLPQEVSARVARSLAACGSRATCLGSSCRRGPSSGGSSRGAARARRAPGRPTPSRR